MKGKKSRRALRLAIMGAAISAVLVFGGVSAALADPGPLTGNTTVNVSVLQSISFSATPDSIDMTVDPGGTASATDNNVQLEVRTNANSGYSVVAHDTSNGLYCAGASASFSRVPVTGPSYPWPGPNYFGAQAAAGSGSPVVNTPYSGTNWGGYTAANTELFHGSKTNSDSVTVKNRVDVNYLQPAGSYSDTITYTASGSY